MQDLIDYMNEEKLNRKWYETVEITDALLAAHAVYMEAPIDWDMIGNPISRSRAGWPDDIATFVAGVQYANSLTLNQEPVAWTGKGCGVMDAKCKQKMIEDALFGGEFAMAAKTAVRHDIPLYVGMSAASHMGAPKSSN